MVEYDMDTHKLMAIKIGKQVNKEDMESLTFSVEALSEGNPAAFISFKLQKGISIRWIKYVEQLCENIPNPYFIGSANGLL